MDNYEKNIYNNVCDYDIQSLYLVDIMASNDTGYIDTDSIILKKETCVEVCNYG